MEKDTDILYKCIEERGRKVVWTHKIHEKQADIYVCRERRIKIWLIILSAVVMGGTLIKTLDLFNTLPTINNILQWGIVLLSLGLSFLTLYHKDTNLERLAQENKNKALQVHDLRNKYEALLTDIRAGLLTNKEIIEQRDKLAEIENIIYKDSPYTSPQAVKKAKKALHQDKESTTEEGEQECLLPSYLQP